MALFLRRDGLNSSRIAAELFRQYELKLDRKTIDRFFVREDAEAPKRPVVLAGDIDTPRPRSGPKRAPRIIDPSEAPAGLVTKSGRVIVPDDPREFLEAHVAWPHIETKEPARDLNAMQIDFLKRRACVRWDAKGRIGGADSVLKSRQVRLTSLVLGLILYSMLRWPRFRAVTIMQDQTRVIVDALLARWEYALDHLPAAWVGDWRALKRWDIYRFPNDSSWSISGAGDSASRARRRGRSLTVDFAHLTEPQDYPYPAELFSSLREAVPQNGYIVSEGTAPSVADQWHGRTFSEAWDGVSGEFRVGHFWPWHFDPIKRIPKRNPDFRRVMGDVFTESKMTAAELKVEAEITEKHKLTFEQIAWRRLKYMGPSSASDKAKNRRENPESLEMAFAPPSDTWFATSALETAVARILAPIGSKRHSPAFTSEYWVDREPDADRFVVLSVDPSQWGRDLTAFSARDAHTLDRLAIAEGKGLASEVAAAAVYVVFRLGCLKNKRHIIWVERQKGGEELLRELAKSWYYRDDLDLFVPSPPKRGAAGQRVRLGYESGRKKPGFWSSRWNRPRIFDALRQALEGPERYEDGGFRTPSPTVQFVSARLIKQLEHIVDDGSGRPEARRKKSTGSTRGEGLRDDLVTADAITLYMAPVAPVAAPPSIREMNTKGKTTEPFGWRDGGMY